MIKIFNEPCEKTINTMIHYNQKCNIILTSPPYNTGKKVRGDNAKSVQNMDARYDVYLESKTDEEYITWTINLFNMFDKVLAQNGVVLYNLSYASGDKNNGYKSTDLMWRLLGEIINNTPFTIADNIIWKKKNALPNNRSANKLTRICEYIFVFVRKDEYMTFQCNKRVLSISNGAQRSGQKSYENIFNFIEAKNNDGACGLNKATYSSELCEKLLTIYAHNGDVIYDPFIGTGTTAVACKRMGLSCFGSEISAAQVEYANNRLEAVNAES